MVERGAVEAALLARDHRLVEERAHRLVVVDGGGEDPAQHRAVELHLLEPRAAEGAEADLLDEVEARCIEQADLAPERMKNHVAAIYDRFPLETLSARVADLIRSDRLEWSGEIEMVYQDLAGLHEAMPGHTGDWYFTGDYPTPGGYRVLNTAYLNWRKNDERRAY